MPGVVIQQIFRRIRSARIRPKLSTSSPAGGSITLTFASSTVDADGGVRGDVGATSASQSFSFGEVSPRVGLPIYLEITESSTLRMVITFTSDYSGKNYTYTTTGGVSHTGTFPSSNGTVNY